MFWISEAGVLLMVFRRVCILVVCVVTEYNGGLLFTVVWNGNLICPVA